MIILCIVICSSRGMGLALLCPRLHKIRGQPSVPARGVPLPPSAGQCKFSACGVQMQEGCSCAGQPHNGSRDSRQPWQQQEWLYGGSEDLTIVPEESHRFSQEYGSLHAESLKWMSCRMLVVVFTARVQVHGPRGRKFYYSKPQYLVLGFFRPLS